MSDKNKKIVPIKRPIHWEKMRADEAEKLIRQRALVTESVIFTDHAYDRVEDREITQPDVYQVLCEGYVDTGPIRDRYGNWQAIIKKRLRGAREAGIVTVIFRETDNLLIVTVMWVD